MNNDERIKQFARDEGRAGWIGFAWGFAEGLFFFIVPDVYVTFATLFSIRAGVTAWAASIAGSLVAVIAIQLMSALGMAYVNFLAAVPGISWTMLEHVRMLLGARGLPYTPLLIAGGVPLKVYAGLAVSLGFSLTSIVVWTVYARLVRIAPVFMVAAAGRVLVARGIDQHPARWLALLVTVWFLFYVFYFLRMGV